jgi:adenosylhomocysteine nucleosidase
MKSRRFLVILTILTIHFHSFCQTNQQSNLTAVLGAFENEIIMLKDSMTHKEELEIFGLPVTKGMLQGRNIILAYTGMGKVNAAMTTTLILDHFRPERVIFTGIAGGINPGLNPGDIVIGKKSVQHDLNIIYNDSIVSFPLPAPMTHITNPVYFTSDSQLIDLTKKVKGKVHLISYPADKGVYLPQIIYGTIATGDSFIASSKKNKELIRRFHADAVEMEGAAVAQICYYGNTPCLIIRSISDSADEQAPMDLEKFLDIAARNSNLMVIALLKEMKE